MFKTFTVAIISSLIVGVVGCTKGKTDATAPLEESFKVAAPEVQQAVVQVNTQLKAGQYAEATRGLAPLVSGRPLTEQQKQAVGTALKQINEAVTANPNLDTREMYELRAKMFKAVHNGPRF